jgi:hypothetical protein
MVACNDDDKEYVIKKDYCWTFISGDTAGDFRFHWEGSYKGDEYKNLLEHGGVCSYSASLIGTEIWWGKNYNYDRDGDIIKIYKHNDSEAVWLEGYISGERMFLSNDTLNYELTQLY